MSQTILPLLLLNGEVICTGDQLAIRVFDSWIFGEAQQDHSGWYLLTTTQVGIRLSAGLTARWVCDDENQ